MQEKTINRVKHGMVLAAMLSLYCSNIGQLNNKTRVYAGQAKPSAASLEDSVNCSHNQKQSEPGIEAVLEAGLYRENKTKENPTETTASLPAYSKPMQYSKDDVKIQPAGEISKEADAKTIEPKQTGKTYLPAGEDSARQDKRKPEAKNIMHPDPNRIEEKVKQGNDGFVYVKRTKFKNNFVDHREYVKELGGGEYFIVYVNSFGEISGTEQGMSDPYNGKRKGSEYSEVQLNPEGSPSTEIFLYIHRKTPKIELKDFGSDREKELKKIIEVFEK